MTYRQELLKNYLLKRLGFDEDDFTKEYEYYLSQIIDIHKGVAATHENKPFYYYNKYIEKFIPTNFTVLDFLILEYALKSKKAFKRVDYSSEYISATDLANFTYCQVSYSIGRTFQLPTNFLREIGTRLHNEQRLLSFIKETQQLTIDKPSDIEWYQRNVQFKDYITKENSYFFDELFSSELIFSGHSINEKKFFINEEKFFIGQPDYIFKNKKGKYFVIEEKFKRNFGADIFFKNHQVQIQSYIYFLNEYSIDYGYLVYWSYGIDEDGYTNIESISVKKIFKNEKTKSSLNNVYDSIIDFKKKKFLNIDINCLTPKKCAHCVYVLVCGHKNKKRKQITLNYQPMNFKFYKAIFPEELKISKDENIFLEDFDSENIDINDLLKDN